jgi:hypothetical protein
MERIFIPSQPKPSKLGADLRQMRLDDFIRDRGAQRLPRSPLESDFFTIRRQGSRSAGGT